MKNKLSMLILFMIYASFVLSETAAKGTGITEISLSPIEKLSLRSQNSAD